MATNNQYYLEEILESLRELRSFMAEELKRVRQYSDSKHERKVLICGYTEEEDCYCEATNSLNSVYNDINDEDVVDLEVKEEESHQRKLQIRHENDRDITEDGDHKDLLAKIEGPNSPIHPVCDQFIHDKVISVPHIDFSSSTWANQITVEMFSINENRLPITVKVFDKIPERMGYITNLNPDPPDGYGQLTHSLTIKQWDLANIRLTDNIENYTKMGVPMFHGIKWFKGGVTNICYICLDKNIEPRNGDKIANYWEGIEVGVDSTLTYTQLLQRVCQLANYLKDIGVKRGDIVLLYSTMLVELPITLLACARIGAVHPVVFARFSAEYVVQRIIDCIPEVVITCNAIMRGPKIIHLKDIVDAAVVESSQNGISADEYLTYENESAMTREATKWHVGRDVWWQDVVPEYPTMCGVEWVDAKDPPFLLYTSGSTRKPNGVLHTIGGYMIFTVYWWC